jgi:subtilase family serine protease
MTSTLQVMTVLFVICTVFSVPVSAQTANWLTPSDVRTAYDVAPLIQSGYTGKGVTVAVIDSAADDYVNSDLLAFNGMYGLPESAISVVKFGGSGITTPSSLFETTADVELVHALAPDATILLILVGYNTTLDGFSYVIEHNAADIATMSWYQWYYGSNGAKRVQSYNQEYAKSVGERITLITISMDFGSNNTVRFPHCPAYPFCSNDTDFWTSHLPTAYMMPTYSPYVTVVGGTELNVRLGAYGSETGWNRSGGGPSNIFPEPSWQTGLGVPQNGWRNIPDVALDASCRTPYEVVWHGTIQGFCGTSGAAPTFAGIVADIVQAFGGRVGFLNPTLYALAASHPSVYHEVTSGCSLVQVGSRSLTGYCAHSGWNFVTGWGSIDAAELASHFQPLGYYFWHGWMGQLTVIGFVVLCLEIAFLWIERRRRKRHSAFN